MFLEDRTRKLCEEIVASGDEAQAVVLAQELQILLHEYIDHLRGELQNLKQIKAA